MECIIKKIFVCHEHIIAFFDKDVSKYAKALGKSDCGDVEIVDVENGSFHSFSAIIETEIPLESLEGLKVNFI